MENLAIITTKIELRDTLREVLREESARNSQSDLTIKMDRKQSAKFLGVSYQTMYNWTKSGILLQHGMGRKKFYLRSELIEAMNKSR